MKIGTSSKAFRQPRQVSLQLALFAPLCSLSTASFHSFLAKATWPFVLMLLAFVDKVELELVDSVRHFCLRLRLGHASLLPS